MIDRTAAELPRGAVPAHESGESFQEPRFLDAIKFLYVRRTRLALHCIVLFGVALIGYLAVYLSTHQIVEGTVALGFRGIERHEYPTGRKFTVEDFRGADLLARALAEAGIEKSVTDVPKLAARIFVTPIIPGDVQARWKKQERDGTRKEEYLPSEFRIAVDIPGLTNAQRVRFFDALVHRYQENVKTLLRPLHGTALLNIAPINLSYDKLASGYDFWDFPSLFSVSHDMLSADLDSVIQDAMQYPDRKYLLAFRQINQDLRTWYSTRLAALEALTYQGQLVKNRDAIVQRVRYRIEDLEVRIRQRSDEAGEQVRLLGLIDRPKAFLSAPQTTEKGFPLVDTTVFEKLLKTDYVGPLVARIAKLQEDRQALEAERTRLQKRFVLLPKATNTDTERLPGGYKEQVLTLSSELRDITQLYNTVMDEFLTMSVISHVAVKQPPIITREGYSPAVALPAIALASIFFAIVLMSMEHLYVRVREEARAVSPDRQSRAL